MDSEAIAPSNPPSRSTYEIRVTEDEYLAALRFNQSRLVRRLPRSYVAVALRISVLVAWSSACGLSWWLLFSDPGNAPKWLALSLFAAILLSIAAQRELQARFLRTAARGGIWRRPRLIVIEEDGLRCCTDCSEERLPWNAIQAIEECGEQILIYLDEVSFVLIPRSTFADPSERAEFLARLRTRLPAGPAVEERTGQSVLSDAPAAPSRTASFGAHLKHGARLVFFLRPTLDLASAGQSWSNLIALVCLNTAVPFVGDRLASGASAEFFSIGIPRVLFVVPLVMLAAWTLARLVDQAKYTLGLFTVLMSLAVPVRIAEAVFRLIWARHTAPWAEAPTELFTVWFALASVAAATRLLGIPWRRWVTGLVVTGLLLVAPMTTLHRIPLWMPTRSAPEEEDEDEKPPSTYAGLASEKTFYFQPRLLQKQLAQIQAGRPGVIDLYFIGVAADSYQDVFMKEVHSMGKLFEDRFGTAGRSLLLINNASTVQDSPVASATSLSAALRRVGEVMDRDEDVLFLFITSHGSKEKGIEFEMSPLLLDALAPHRLKEMLDESGIRRRVVLVSACYSGQFVEALKDEDTLVMSAAAADKTSFGCSNDADFTFFGKAYFDALQTTYSFSDAFEWAKPMVATRERESKYDASDPQIFVGQRIKRALEDFARARGCGGLNCSTR